MSKIKLSDWAKSNGKTYREAWNMASKGEFPGEIERNSKGSIFIIQPDEKPKSPQSFGIPQVIINEKNQIIASRFNKSALTTPAFQYAQIENGLLPYQLDGGNSSNACISVSDAIRLCQKTYFNFAIFKSVIDCMTEFSTNRLYFRGGNAKSRKFFEEWWDSIGGLTFEDKFFREYHRSSNVVIYRFDGKPKDGDIDKLNKTFGSAAAKDTEIPIKYIILNPVDIGVENNFSFGGNVTFYKTLNGYEINRLRKPQTSEEKKFLQSLPENIQKEIKSGGALVRIPLDNSKLTAVFYCKQDYEAMAVPMFFPVLKDIEWKSEMQKIDIAVSRTMQNFVLLVKMGYEGKDGSYNFDQQAANAMKTLFETETVGRTLVADFTTEVSFVIPTIGDFLDPRKYQIVNEDIKTGLNYVLTGTDQKFSNQYIQVQLFIQRLVRAREAFLNEFLIKEMNRIGDSMGFKSIPTPYFHDIDLKDTAEFNRILAQLYQYGLLTPGETFEALESGRLPNSEESLEAQEEFRKYKDKGYYEPITGGPATQEKMLDKTNKQQIKMTEMQQEHDDKQKAKDRKHKAENPEPAAPQIVLNAPTKMVKPNGRPGGSTKKQSGTRKTRVSKASEDIEEYYSLTKIKDNLLLASQLKQEVHNKLSKKYKVEQLNPEQIEIVKSITEVIMANNDSSVWLENVDKYVENPVNDNSEKNRDIDEISYKHQIDNYTACILASSKKELEESNE